MWSKTSKVVEWKHKVADSGNTQVNYKYLTLYFSRCA